MKSFLSFFGIAAACVSMLPGGGHAALV